MLFSLLSNIVVALAFFLIGLGLPSADVINVISIPLGLLLLLLLVLVYVSYYQPKLENEKKKRHLQENRFEFLQEKNNPLNNITLFLKLKKEFSPSLVSHFRILIEIVNLEETPNHPMMYITSRDAYGIIRRGSTQTMTDGTHTHIYTRNPDYDLQNTTIGAVEGFQISRIVAQGGVYKKGPFLTMADFDRAFVNIYLTENLVNKISYIGVAANNFVLLGLFLNNKDIRFIKTSRSDVPWKEKLSETENKISWCKLVTNEYWPDDKSRPPLRPPIRLDFNKYSPIKTDVYNLKGWQPVRVPLNTFHKLFPPT